MLTTYVLDRWHTHDAAHAFQPYVSWAKFEDQELRSYPEFTWRLIPA